MIHLRNQNQVMTQLCILSLNIREVIQFILQHQRQQKKNHLADVTAVLS